MDEIVVNWTLVTAATVLLAFVVNQAAAWGGLELSATTKKGVAFGVAVLLSGYFAYSGANGGFNLPDPGADPAVFALALLSLATTAFKVAQQVYDKLWLGLIDA